MHNIKRYYINGWQFEEELYNDLTDYEKSFLDLEIGYYKTLDFYKQRLDKINFSNHDLVLDAGCGVGQWSIALAKLNKWVEGIDLNPSRVEFAKNMCQSMKVKNINLKHGGLESLPYGDNCFDAIFCYGVFMFTDTEKTLKEFNRVLKKNGKIYINYNSCGWYAHLILDRGVKGKNINIIKSATKMVLNYFFGKKKSILIRSRWMKAQLKKNGFSNIITDSEGCLNLNENVYEEKAKSSYQSHYYGMRAVVEMVAEKK